MISSRWLALGIFLILLTYIVFFDKRLRWQDKVRTYGAMFLEGMLGGFIIDAIGINAGYYYFPRQPFLSLEYFAIVIPAWGVFGLLINCLWNWLGKEKFWKGMAVTLIPLFVWYEGTNLLTNSWVYTVPFRFVVLGWIPLIWTFAGCNRRRRVVFKIEQWRNEFQEQSFEHQIIWGLLTTTRVILTVAMFPLLLTVLVRVCADLPMLVKQKIPVWSYTKHLLAME